MISSSSAFAHGVRPDEGAVHVWYCYTPFRYAWYREYWGVEADIVHPPVELHRFSPGTPGDHLLFVGELVRHKQVEVALEAEREARTPIRIVGGGTDEARLRAEYATSAEFLGRVGAPAGGHHRWRARRALALTRAPGFRRGALTLTGRVSVGSRSTTDPDPTLAAQGWRVGALGGSRTPRGTRAPCAVDDGRSAPLSAATRIRGLACVPGA